MSYIWVEAREILFSAGFSGLGQHFTALSNVLQMPLKKEVALLNTTHQVEHVNDKLYKHWLHSMKYISQ